MRGEHFQRHGSAQPGVQGPKHAPHPPAADELEQLEMSQTAPGGMSPGIALPTGFGGGSVKAGRLEITVG